jgi:hypothetical protein
MISRAKPHSKEHILNKRGFILDTRPAVSQRLWSFLANILKSIILSMIFHERPRNSVNFKPCASLSMAGYPDTIGEMAVQVRPWR